jgi:hypothetical protein
MQGIFIGFTRPRSKAQVRTEVLANPADVRIEATSWFGNEYDGLVSDAPDGEYHFVGPDPHTKRNFYGTIVKHGTDVKVK